MKSRENENNFKTNSISGGPALQSDQILMLYLKVPVVHRVYFSVLRLKTVLPWTIVCTTPPRRFQPEKGVFVDLDLNSDGFTVQKYSGSMIVISAGEPGFSVPPGICKTFAGPKLISAAMR